MNLGIPVWTNRTFAYTFPNTVKPEKGFVIPGPDLKCLLAHWVGENNPNCGILRDGLVCAQLRYFLIVHAMFFASSLILNLKIEESDSYGYIFHG